MSIYDFIKFNVNERATILWEKGIFLDSHIEFDHAINLYFLNGFFVEVTISRTKEEIIDVIPFKSGYRLDKYTDTKELNLA